MIDLIKQIEDGDDEAVELEEGQMLVYAPETVVFSFMDDKHGTVIKATGDICESDLPVYRIRFSDGEKAMRCDCSLMPVCGGDDYETRSHLSFGGRA